MISEKNKVLELLLTELENKKQALEKTASDFRKSASESSKSTESWSDSSRTEFNMLGGRIEGEIQVLESGLKFLKGLESQIFKVIEVGALVLAEDSGVLRYYFLTPSGCGGITLNFEGEKVFAVSPESLIGEKLLGKKIGEAIDLNGKELRIKEIL